MDKRIERVLILIRKKLDTEDIATMVGTEELGRSVEKMIDSLDKLIYHRDFFGKNSPEILFIKEMKMTLKEMVRVNTYADIEHVKFRIHGMRLNKSGRLRSSLNHEKSRSTRADPSRT